MLYLGEKCGLVNSYQVSATHCPPGPLYSGSNNHFFNNYCHSFFDFVDLFNQKTWQVLMGGINGFWRHNTVEISQKKYVLFCCCNYEF